MARGSLRVEAVWSRTEGPARALAAQLQAETPGCAPEAFHGESGLQAILEGGSVEAVIIVLAAHVQVEVAKKALMSGNHVLSEKPLGLGPAEAWGAIRWYEALPCAPVWHVAENYRFERAYDRALGLVAGADADRPLGAALKLDLVADCPMTPENKYFQSAWRRDPAACPGGFAFESGVHFVAAIRLAAGRLGWGDPEEASALAGHGQPALPAPDSLVGWLKFPGEGRMASVSMTFGAAHRRFQFAVVCTGGTVTVSRAAAGGYAVECGALAERVPFSGLDGEVQDFIEHVQAYETRMAQRRKLGAVPSERGQAREGACDVSVMSALLASGRQGGAPVPIRYGVEPDAAASE